MSQRNPAFKEVLDAHVAIQQWLSGTAPADRLDALMARFSPLYSMITLPGQVLDYQGLRALFQQAHGKRAGLEISIDELHLIAEGPSLAVVGYREWQADAAGNRSVRRSTVVFERANGALRWRHLHETQASG
ncbi:nuclear transport factor 2 family protein [Pseudomonas wadenswilerensis]|jgi:hypothetical protein|uniref:SnoaL-like domain-containing protein n=1 Tax=Pseudomonas wadenswilerensis TaxID=1785161 RepID=A0A380SZC8_9PSED|nr:nuclear transport factor 2 family protein [Pseudomonas wadenswilerensis]SUQ63392.1 hypothetical protein CCOS864_02842 [Pseudomonas wadenswilerensis]